MEGRGFRDQADEFEKRGVQIYGASFDKPADNAAFRDKQSFPYPLWSDTDKALARHYGAAKTSLQPFPSRVTVILDADGAVFETIPNERDKPGAADHADVALAILDRR